MKNNFENCTIVLEAYYKNHAVSWEHSWMVQKRK